MSTDSSRTLLRVGPISITQTDLLYPNSHLQTRYAVMAEISPVQSIIIPANGTEELFKNTYLRVTLAFPKHTYTIRFYRRNPITLGTLPWKGENK